MKTILHFSKFLKNTCNKREIIFGYVPKGYDD
jgi:hypothetical protein